MPGAPTAARSMLLKTAPVCMIIWDLFRGWTLAPWSGNLRNNTRSAAASSAPWGQAHRVADPMDVEGEIGPCCLLLDCSVIGILGVGCQDTELGHVWPSSSPGLLVEPAELLPLMARQEGIVSAREFGGIP